MFVIRSFNSDIKGMVHMFSNGNGHSGLCIFPTREMAQIVLDRRWTSNEYIEELPDDFFYRLFLEMPENSDLRREFKIDQVIK